MVLLGQGEPHLDLVPNDLRESLSDNWMRDHRKIVFYDLDEREPWKGGALFTGEGVGEEYENAGPRAPCSRDFSRCAPSGPTSSIR